MGHRDAVKWILLNITNANKMPKIVKYLEYNVEYNGGDREVMAHKKPDVCKEHSCKLNKCQQHLDDMIDCCRKWGHQAFSCEGFMWMFKEEFPDKTGPGGRGGEPKTGDNKPTTGDKPDDNKDNKK
ncbi:unnamed protein product [Oppiella nova]|uniref:Uncharacterized protein n=1 Tax=Oppiella nova TaxID=334625 RepID=A0A7R9M9J7_9ACAR|nr:unnamed protein product [Oppiella nova]CAG2173247.1 unnamed protein product [Oppiella nova]